MAILNSYLLQNLANDEVGFISISLKKKKTAISGAVTKQQFTSWLQQGEGGF